jgi:amino acid transporter
MELVRLLKRIAAIVSGIATFTAIPMLGVVYDIIGPTHEGLAIISLVAVFSCMGVFTIAVRRHSKERLRRYAFRLLLALPFVLVSFSVIESIYVYRTPFTPSERRIRGYELVDDEVIREYAKGRSMEEMIAGNEWRAEGLFTDSSINTIRIVHFLLWAAGLTIVAFFHLCNPSLTIHLNAIINLKCRLLGS